MQFGSNVEQWRTLVAKYVPAQYVDKALWVIQYESNGNPTALGDNGVAVGLFQIQDNVSFSNRPTKEQLLNPEYNVWYAATQLGMANGNFAAWGENNTYNGKPFGALGNHPFPGDTSAPHNGTAITTGLPLPNPGDVISGTIDAGGNILDAAGNIVGIITGGVSGMGSLIPQAIGVLKAVAKAFVWLLDPHHWFRLFFIGTGFVMIIAGVYIYIRGDKVVSDASRVGKVAAEA